MARRERATTTSAGALKSWDDLRFFLALARHKTLAATARQLGVQVSTVHRRLGSLEEQCGFELFRRTPSGHALTARGQQLLDQAKRVEEAVLDLEMVISGVDNRRVIRLATTDDLIDFLSPHVARFCEQHPGVQVRLSAAERVSNLVRREADVAIRFVAARQQELVDKPLCTMAFALYGSPAYLERHGRPTAQRDLDEHTFVFAEGPLGSSPALCWLAERIEVSQIRCTCNTVSTMAAAARGGLGLAVLPCFMADPKPELIRVGPDIITEPVRPHLSYHSSLRKSPQVRAFTRYLRKLFKEHSALFEGNAPADG